MGFWHDPGPLPFTTIRDAKWANRIVVGDLVQVQGERGDFLPKTPTRVVSIEPYREACPSHLLSVYLGKALVAVRLEPVALDDSELRRWMFPV